MRRYWVEPNAVYGDVVTFKDEVYHHVVDVCRMDVGSKFEVLTGDGRALFCEMFSVQKGKRPHAQARVLETREIPPLKKPYVHLALSLPRFATTDLIVEKAVELGVASIHPFFSDFSFIKQSDKVSESKIKRWDKIIQGATQQSGRGTLMRMAEPVSLAQIFAEMNRLGNAAGLFAYEGECELTLKQGLQKLHGGPEHVWVFVGSEGGFSTQEVSLFRSQGLEPLSLGAQVLRVETACLALLSIIKYEFDL